MRTEMVYVPGLVDIRNNYFGLGAVAERRINTCNIAIKNKYPCPFSISISDMTRILTRQELKNTDSMLFIQDEGFILFPSLKILTLQIAVKRINAKQKN